jgi:hypothetical protein
MRQKPTPAAASLPYVERQFPATSWPSERLSPGSRSSARRFWAHDDSLEPCATGISLPKETVSTRKPQLGPAVLGPRRLARALRDRDLLAEGDGVELGLHAEVGEVLADGVGAARAERDVVGRRAALVAVPLDEERLRVATGEALRVVAEPLHRRLVELGGVEGEPDAHEPAGLVRGLGVGLRGRSGRGRRRRRRRGRRRGRAVDDGVARVGGLGIRGAGRDEHGDDGGDEEPVHVASLRNGAGPLRPGGACQKSPFEVETPPAPDPATPSARFAAFPPTGGKNEEPSVRSEQPSVGRGRLAGRPQLPAFPGPSRRTRTHRRYAPGRARG